MRSASSSSPALASSSAQTRSASWAPLQAVETMARSSLRFGAKMPGVSTRMIWALFSMTMPRISARVVCTLRETMVTFEPTKALTSVDLPTLGAPISATKPQRVLAVASAVIAAADAFARDHDACRDLLRGTLAAAHAFGRREARQVDGDAELRIVVRPGAFDLAIDRGRQALALRPFLQDGLGIAQGLARLLHPLGPVGLDELLRSRVAAVEEHRADHRLADIAEHGFAQPRAGAGADRAEFDVVGQPKRFRDVSAALLPHEFSKALRQLALVGIGEAAIEHVGDDQPEHVIAEE